MYSNECDHLTQRVGSRRSAATDDESGADSRGRRERANQAKYSLRVCIAVVMSASASNQRSYFYAAPEDERASSGSSSVSKSKFQVVECAHTVK